MKYLPQVALIIVTQVPAYAAASVQAVPGEWWQLVPWLPDRTNLGSLFVSVLLLQICLVALVCELMVKVVGERGGRTNAPDPNSLTENQLPSRFGESLYQHLMSGRAGKSQLTDAYFGFVRGPKRAADSSLSPLVAEVPECEGANSNSRQESCIIANDLSGLANQAEDWPRLLYFSVLDVADDSQISRQLNFNSINFACDHICDAIFASDMNIADQLIKSYGAVPTVMSLVERKLSKAAIDCHWRLRREAQVGELVITGGSAALCFSSASSVSPEVSLKNDRLESADMIQLEPLPILTSIVAETLIVSDERTVEEAGVPVLCQKALESKMELLDGELTVLQPNYGDSGADYNLDDLFKDICTKERLPYLSQEPISALAAS